jgi:preprotein translocase subunit YajC
VTLGLTQWVWTLAEAATKADGKPAGGGGNTLVLMIGVLLAVFLFMTIMGRGRKREQRSRERMLTELGRNDRVVTIGGMIGVVTDVKDDEITVKIDEASNTKIRMKKWAVRALDAKESESGGEKKACPRGGRGGGALVGLAAAGGGVWPAGPPPGNVRNRSRTES